MIRIITDSTSDLSLERAKEIGVDVLPLTVRFGDESYLDGITITKEAFYEKLAASDALPTTSQINPLTFEERFRPYIEAGDEIIAIFISSKLSGTVQSATIAKNALGSDRIHIIDSLHVTFTLGLLVEIAAMMRDQGLSAEEITKKILDLRSHVRLYTVFSTLKYLKMGGRISATTAVVGTLLNVLPIVSIEKGEMTNIGKARGKKAAFAKLRSFVEAAKPNPDYPIAFGYTSSKDMVYECMKGLDGLADTEQALIFSVGAIVGTYAGPGATGIAYVDSL